MFLLEMKDQAVTTDYPLLIQPTGSDSSNRNGRSLLPVWSKHLIIKLAEAAFVKLEG